MTDTIEKTATCFNCQHWTIEPKDLKNGVCRGCPPSVVLVPTAQGLAANSFFPVTSKDTSCGMFKTKKSIINS